MCALPSYDETSQGAGGNLPLASSLARRGGVQLMAQTTRALLVLPCLPLVTAYKCGGETDHREMHTGFVAAVKKQDAI